MEARTRGDTVRSRGGAVLCLASIATAWALATPGHVAGQDRAAPEDRGAVQTEMRNVHMLIAPGISLTVQALRGEVSPRRQDEPAALDDKDSFLIHIDAAVTKMSYAAMTRLMNDYVFAGEDPPLRDVEVAREDDPEEADRIEIKGSLAAVLGTPFEIEGVPSATPDGKVRIRAESVQALDVGVGGLLDLLGLDAAGIVGQLQERGVAFDGNDVILDPARLLPPPRIEGSVTATAIDDEGMTMIFGKGSAGVPEIESAPFSNFLFYRHGIVRIGKMTMERTDLRIVDMDARDPFEFSIDDMNRQLVAGTISLEPDGGLVVHTPDHDDLDQR